MFISKKKFEERLHKEKMEVAAEWEKKMDEYSDRLWRNHERSRTREDTARRFNYIEERILKCEKELGLVKEPTHYCPFEPKAIG